MDPLIPGQIASFDLDNIYQDEPSGGEMDSLSDLQIAILQLRAFWRTEKAAPVVRPITPVIADILQHVTDIPEEPEDGEEQLAFDMRVLELNRLAFLVKDYLRTRLTKIEHIPHYYSTHPENLTQEEEQYASSLSKLIDSHFHKKILRHLKKLEFAKIPDFSNPSEIQSSRRKHVFSEIMEDLDITLEDRTITLSQDQRIYGRFEDIEPFLDEGKARLI
eukprot:gnl/Dysnectes_brevis/2246_a2629_1413.p1 GENE.gnl/Dysnectes_brevis/2246_a2629_1413~~gnl/Dysnectes_brevis/2246_a2629_1413.p1  ORF type:complete len:219 (-),score=16.66 gnl/Dysnectes_brevis/2246_a2629_1413:56-712(-)